MMTFDDPDARWSLNEASDRHAHASAPGRRLAAGQGEVRVLGRTSSATAQDPSFIPPDHTQSARRSLNNLQGFGRSRCLTASRGAAGATPAAAVSGRDDEFVRPPARARAPMHRPTRPAPENPAAGRSRGAGRLGMSAVCPSWGRDGRGVNISTLPAAARTG